MGVVNALIKGEIEELKKVKGELEDTFEDHVWFEDRWMVAYLCDE
jgi:hypothetical protein